MSGEPSDTTRRRFLEGSVLGTIAGLAGCLRLGGGGGSDATTTGPRPTEGTATVTGTETPAVPSNATFDFTYEPPGSVRIRFGGGGAIRAGGVQIRSTDGTSAAWPQLGSTDETPAETLEAGSTARVGPAVLNWGDSVGASESVLVVYRADGAPTTLARFTPPATGPTTTRTPTETETTTRPDQSTTTPPSGAVFADEFEDGRYRDTWQVTRHHDVEEVTESGGVLTYRSPVDATIYESDMTVLTRDTLPATGRQVLETRHRIRSYQAMPVLRLRTPDDEKVVRLSEHTTGEGFYVDYPAAGGSGDKEYPRIRLDDPADEEEWYTYRLTVDFDAGVLVSVERGDTTHELDREMRVDLDGYRIGIGEGNGVDQYEYLRVRYA